MWSRKQGKNSTGQLLGLLLTVAGIGLGIIAVSQPQLIGSKALIVGYRRSPTPFTMPTRTPSSTPNCSTGLDCENYKVDGSTKCNLPGRTIYCCPRGKVASQGKCVAGPTPRPCAKGLDCRLDVVSGAGDCRDMGNGLLWSCCPKGQVVRNNRCVIPINPPTGNACDKPWVKFGCGSGGCSANQHYEIRAGAPSGCGASTRCVLDASCISPTNEPVPPTP